MFGERFRVCWEGAKQRDVVERVRGENCGEEVRVVRRKRGKKRGKFC